MEKDYKRLTEAYKELQSVFEKYGDVIHTKIISLDYVIDAHLKTREIVERCGFHRMNFYALEYNTDHFQVDTYMYYTKWNTHSKISWPDDEDKVPEVGDELLILSFPSGGYMFYGEDHLAELFDEFFNELKSYKPDFSDSVNSNLYFKVERCQEIYDDFPEILQKYKDKAVIIMREEKIRKLEDELRRFKSKDV